MLSLGKFIFKIIQKIKFIYFNITILLLEKEITSHFVNFS